MYTGRIIDPDFFKKKIPFPYYGFNTIQLQSYNFL